MGGVDLTETGGGFTQELAESVAAAKAQPEMKNGHMYFSDILKKEKEKAAGEERGRSEGIAIGEERDITAGAEHKSLETARNMLARGYDTAEVAEITGLSPEQMRELETER